MPPRRLTRDEKKAETRARLLEAGARVFAREGFRGATIEQIADEAGYTHGALYSNFSGKEELFLALAEDYALARTRETAEALEHVGETSDQARAAADVWMRRLASDPDTFILRLEFALHAARTPDLRERFASRSGALRLLVEDTLRERLEGSRAAYPLPPEELAVVLRAVGVGLAIERLIDPDAVREELFGDFAAALLDLIEGRTPRGPAAQTAGASHG